MKQSDGGLALSYNVQISTDAAQGLIVGVAVTQSANDSAQLLAAVERVEERLEKPPQQVVADGGYTTRENIERMADRAIDFLGSWPWENVPSGTTHPNRLPPSAFVYDAGRNCFICPEGKLLGYDCRHSKQAGALLYRYTAARQDCQHCARRPQCCPGNEKRGRSIIRLQESAPVIAFREKMRSEKAREQYRRRARVVEFCHAWIKSKLGLRQFHVRGMRKVQMEMLWACLTHNLPHWIRLRKSPAVPATT
jgi:hypothetical protein